MIPNNKISDKCFIEWRGSVDQHRSYDVMISENDVNWIREEIHERAQRFCKDIPMPEEGAVIAIGEELRRAVTEVGVVPDFTVCTGKGPKLVVNPNYDGKPVRIDELRDERPRRNRVVNLFQSIFRRMNWKEIHENLTSLNGSRGLLFTIPDKFVHLRSNKYILLEHAKLLEELVSAIMEIFEVRYENNFPYQNMQIKQQNGLVEFWVS